MPRERRATLADVAARAGVSVTTASYVLNLRAEQMRISADASERVRQAATELSYRPNRSARTLRTSRTSTIAIVSDNVASGHYASQMLSGAAAAAREREHLVMIAETQADPVLEAELVQELLDREVDGIVYATLTARQVDVPPSLDGVSVVLLNCVDNARGLPCVVPDEVAGGHLAVQTVLGTEPPGELYVIGEDPTPDAIAGVRRLRGVHEELGLRGATLAGVVPCPWEVRPAYDAVAAWLDTGVRPTRLICLNDRVAMGTYQALSVHGLDVPSDVSIVSFDGSGLAAWLRPELTSVALPFTEMGAQAVELLLDAPGAPAGEVLVPMPLMAGASVRSEPEPAHGRPAAQPRT